MIMLSKTTVLLLVSLVASASAQTASDYDDFFFPNPDFMDTISAYLLEELGLDEEVMQCMMETNDMVCSSDALWEEERAMNGVLSNAMDAGMSMDVPQDVQDAMFEACMDAGGVVEKYNKFDCTMEDGVGNFSVNGISMCRADNPSCM